MTCEDRSPSLLSPYIRKKGIKQNKRSSLLQSCQTIWATFLEPIPTAILLQKMFCNIGPKASSMNPHSYPSGSYGTGHILLPKLSIFSIKAHSYGIHLPLQTVVLRSQFTQHYLVHRNTASLLYLFYFKYFRTFNSSIYKGHK